MQYADTYDHIAQLAYQSYYLGVQTGHHQVVDMGG